MSKKKEIDYVVKQHVNNGMIILAEYTDRMKMLYENENVNKENFIVIESETVFARYNEVSGKKMVWKN